MADSEYSGQIDVEVSPESLNAMAGVITDALNRAQKPVLESMNRLISSMAKKQAAEFAKAVDKTKALDAATKNYSKSASVGDKATLGFVQQVTKLTKAIEVQVAAINSAASANRNASQITQRELISQRVALDRSEQLKLQILREAGKRQAVEAQASGNLQLVAARQVQQQRVLITRLTVETIGRLEKGLLRLLTGFGRTTVSALSKTFSTLGSLFTRQNREYTSGLSSALSKRESMLSSSFSKQERYVSQSVTRTRQQVETLRTSLNTGLLGVTNRLGLLGGLAAGAGAAGAIASTFTIGADFTRGLAVLEAQLDLTGKQMADVRQLSIDLGNDITLPGVSALDAAEAIGVLAKQFGGLGPAAADAAQAAAKGTLQLARAAGASAEDAGRIIGSAVNVFGVAADQATVAADIIEGALTKAAGTGLADFTQAFAQGAGTFAEFIVPAEGAKEALVDFNAALAVLAQNGRIGSDAGTSLKQFFIQGTRSADEAQAASAALAASVGEAGNVFFDADGNARQFADTLDILRQALKGMSDEERTATLTTLFGSDASQAASALVSTSAEEYDKLKDSIREQGLAAKIAAAQNSGLKGALDAAKSILETVQILLYEKVNVRLGEFVLAIASAVNTVLFADGAWATLRQGLLGVAAGLAAVLAAKAAIEVLQLLGKAAGLLLSPFGALIVVAGLIGGAFAVMSSRSAPLREALGTIRDRIDDLRDRLSGTVGPLLERFAGFLTDTVVPAVDRAANWLGEHLVGAFDATVRFISGTAIPALVDFGRSLVNFVVPAAKSVAEAVQAAFDTVRSAVSTALSAIQPYVQPAIDGFRELGSAIKAALGGDFSGLAGGADAAVSGIGSSISAIASRIGELLAPAAKRVVDFLKGVFSRENLLKAAKGFLDLVEEIGRIIGLIASDPRLLAAVAAIAAVAVVIAAKFVKGFAEGVLANIGPLLGKIPGVIAKVLFDPGILIPALVAVFAVSKILPAITSAFSSVGQSAAGAFQRGLGTSIKTGALGAKDFVTTLLGGDNAALKTWSNRLDRDLTKTVTSLQNRLRVLGSTMVVDPRNIEAARAELMQLEDAFTPAQKAALQVRDRVSGISQAFYALRVTGAGALAGLKTIAVSVAGAMLTPFSDFVGGVKTGFRSIRDSFSMAAGEMKRIATEQFGSVGKAAGAALRTGLTAAMVGLGGFMGGKAEGSSGGSGLMSALTAGLTGLAVGGPIIGAAGAGMALIGAAMGRAEAHAKKMKAAVEELSATIVERMGSDARDAVVELSDAFAALTDARSTDILGKDVVKTLRDLGIEMADLQSAASAAGGDFESFLKILADSTGVQELWQPTRPESLKAIEKLADLFGVLNDAVNEGQVALDFYGKELSATTGSAAGIDKFIAMFDKGPISEFNGVLKASANAFTELTTAKQPTAINMVNDALDSAIAKATAANTALTAFLNPTGDTALQQALDTQITAVAGAGTQIQTGRASGTDSGAASAREAQRRISEAAGAGLQAAIEDGFTDPNALAFITAGILRSALEGVTDQSLIDEITSTYNTALAGAQPLVDAAAAANDAQAYQEKFQTFLKNNPVLQDVRPEIQQEVFDALGTQTETVGADVIAGIERGILVNKWKAITAAFGVADEVVRVMKVRLDIHSPSQVMRDIGGFIGEGLALGLEDSTASVGSLVANAIDDAIARATDAASRGRTVLAELSASLFGSAVGSDASISFGTSGPGVGNALAGVTSASGSFVDQFNQTVESIFAAARKHLEGTDPLTSAESRLLGADPFSLDPANTIGAQNRAGFLQSLDAIAGLGDSLLAVGEPLDQVIGTVKLYRDQLVEQARALGFSGDALAGLVDQLGLSDSALSDLASAASLAASSMADADAAAAANAQAADAQNRFSASQRILQDQIDWLLREGADGKQIGQFLAGQGVNADIVNEVMAASGETLRAILMRTFGLSTTTFMSANTAGVLGARIGNAASANFDQNGNPTSLFGPQTVQQFIDSVVVPVLGAYNLSDSALASIRAVDSVGGLMDLLENLLGVAMPDFLDAVGANVAAVDSYIAELNRAVPVMRQLPANAAASAAPAPGAGKGEDTSQNRYFTVNNHIYLPSGDPKAVALEVTNRQARAAMVPV